MYRGATVTKNTLYGIISFRYKYNERDIHANNSAFLLHECRVVELEILGPQSSHSILRACLNSPAQVSLPLPLGLTQLRFFVFCISAICIFACLHPPWVSLPLLLAWDSLIFCIFVFLFLLIFTCTLIMSVYLQLLVWDGLFYGLL